MMGSLVVQVLGRPAPQGSKDYVGRGRMVESAKGLPLWRGLVCAAAVAAIRCCDDPACFEKQPGYPIEGPVEVSMTFTWARPKSAPKSRVYPTTYPDLSKLARAVEDALTAAGVWRDDALVVLYRRLAKVYPGMGEDALPVPGVLIRVFPFAPDAPAV